MNLFTRAIFTTTLTFLVFGLQAQNTPIAIDNTPANDCAGMDCWDFFNFSPVQDGMLNVIGGDGIAQDAGCGTTIGATVEYAGPDATPDFTGTLVGANTTDGTTPDVWTFSFDIPLTNPVFDINSLENDTELCFTDCLGNPLVLTILGTSLDPGLSGANCVTNGTNLVQITGTYDCIVITGTVPDNDPYTIGVATCLAENPPPPTPPCTTCPVATDYKLISLDQTGTDVMSGLPVGNIELNNVIIGSYEFLFSDLDVNNDGKGTTFGGWDIDGGTMILKADFCDPLTVQQLDIRNLEVESEVSVGTAISGSGATAVLSGQILTVCSDPSGRMGVEANPDNGEMNFIKTDGPGCGANPNGSYTFGTNPVSTLYFKYHNPPGGCTGDYVGFRIGACAPDLVPAIPVCPLTLVTATDDIDDVLLNGVTPANTYEYIVDANGNYFDKDMCSDFDPLPIVAQPTIAISPCATVVDEEECSFCTPPVPCTSCPVGADYKYISLDKTGTNAMSGLDIGLVEINGVCIGSYEFLFSDLDIRTDGQGTTFGGFDNDGGTMLLQLDFCDPLTVQQLDVRNLEVMSQVSVGTTISGAGAAATLGGQVLTFCAGSTRMDADDITGGNLITTAGPGCGANPNASYTFGTNPVNTLYFKYHNPPGGCSFDYVGFKIGTCVTPPPMEIPVCPLEVVRVTCDMEDVIANGANGSNSDEYVVDGKGNYFDFQTCHATLIDAVNNATPLQTVNIGCAELVETTEECVIMGCVITPQCMASTCPPNTTFEYISLNRTNVNPALPIGIVNLNNVQVGTYEFLFGDLDNSLDGNGTTFGGWDTDGGTMLLKLDFCTPLNITELDIRNLEVGSQVSVGTASSTTDATAVLSGQTLTFCNGSTRMTLNDGAPNLVITDGPGCGANPNATYTVGTNPVSTLYFKYHNPPSDGTFPSRCRGDYVGFRIAACAPKPQDATPECSLQLFNVTDANGTKLLVRDKNGKYYNYAGACPNTFPTTPLTETIISGCATVTFVEECSVCVLPGLAKTVSSCVQASSGIAGNADVTFKFTLANFGAAEMINLQINDDIASIGGFVKIVSPPAVTMTSAGGLAPTTNAAYAGMGNLLNGTSGALNNGEQIMVEVVVEIDPTNTGSSETNSATGGGTPPAGNPVFLDDSDNGTVPHQNNEPTDLDNPTPLQFPKINLAKQIVDVRPAGAPDRFYIDFMLHVKNTGNVTLNNVIIVDDIASQLGAAFIGVTVPPTEDPAYNGASNIDIPIGTLLRNETRWISFTIEIMTPVAGSNQASASGEGVGPGGMIVPVTDLSDAGADPEGNNPGTPGGGPGSSDPTFFGPGSTNPNGSVSLSCPANINLTLDENCKATLPANFGGTSPNGALIAIELFVDGVYVGNMLDQSHLGKKIIYKFTDLSTGLACWGNINLEDKNIPTVKTSTVSVMCSQPAPNWIKLSDVEKSVNGACGTTVTNLAEQIKLEGDACSGFRTIRKITGLIDIDGQKSAIDLRIDTIIESPLDTSMVTCPLGGPGQQDGLKIPCEAIGNAYPTPDIVASYYKSHFKKLGYVDKAATNLANQRAYPHLLKGTGSSTIIDKITEVVTQTLVPTKILVKDDNGNQYWVLEDVIVKDTTYDTTFVTQTYPVALPLPKGVTCNLSVKCTDMQFAGCAGDSSKIMRTWQILDWCNGSIKECMQWIIVEPETPFFTTVQGKKVTLNTDKTIDFYKMWPGGIIRPDIAPWTCAAELALKATVNGSCAPKVDISWSSTFGTIGSDNVLRGLWYGEKAHVTATVYSCADHGEPVEFTFWVEPRNYINPVAIAEDEVNVSLIGDPTGVVSNDGIAKVFVDAIDAGSHNAGCGEVDLCIIRKDELEDPILINDKPVYVNGQQIYHAHGCGYDGILKGVPETKLTPGRPDYYYVICKDFVKFCCSDLGENLVALVVTNESGHSSHSWSTVNVEDKSRSVFYCKPGATIACGKGYNPLDYAPSFQSTVCGVTDLKYTVAGDADACGNGLDVITWTLDGKVICTTKIYFDGQSSFNPYEIKWPKHYTGEEVHGVVRECELWLELDSKGKAVPVLDKDGKEQYRIVEYWAYIPMGAAFDCAEGSDTGQPVWCQAACALVGSSFEPLEVEAADACKKIIRRWTVIDWCTWDPNTSNPDDENDTAYDQFMAVDDEWLDAYDPGHTGQWWTDYREGYVNPPVNVPDGGLVTKLSCSWCDKQNAKADHVYFRYTQVDKDGYYTYDQVIKVIDETDPVIEAADKVEISILSGADSKGDNFDDCKTSTDITASVTDMCGDSDLSANGAAWWIEVYQSDKNSKRVKLLKTKTDFGASATMNSQIGSQGAYHLIVWQVRDGCGNLGESETLVYFHDDKQPTPICLQDLSTAIMPSSGNVEIWAADYDNGSFDNCSDVEFWFLLDDSGYPTDNQETGTYSKNLLVTCEMLRALGGIETIVLGLYVSDAEGNIDFCNITLNVNGSSQICDLSGGASARIEGEVATAFGDKVEGTEVLLSVGAKDLTNVDGKYAFNATILNEPYAIKASRNGDYINGVSTLDLVLIQKHVLGMNLLDSPYKVIAADINNDGKVSATDMVDLRRLILGLTDKLPNNNSWRFVDAAQSFENQLAPFPFTEVLNISKLQHSMKDQNFVGVKIGDVSGNAVSNSAMAENRSVAGALEFVMENRKVRAGELVEIPVFGTNFNNIAGYQFTMELSGLDYAGSTSGAIEMGDANFGLIDPKTVTTSWNHTAGVASEGLLFTMTFKASEDVQLNQAIKFTSRVTEATAYTSTSDKLDIALRFNNVEKSDFRLMQNTPNPFSVYTKIGFELPTAGNATLTVFDVTGKVVLERSGTFKAGDHEFTIDKVSLGGSGVLYYQLLFLSGTEERSEMVKTLKMIVID